MRKILKFLAIAAATISLFGCSDDENDVKKLITFHVANSRSNSIASELTRTSTTMPASGFTVITENNQFMYNGDLEDVHLAEVNMPDGSPIRGFYFIANDRGSKRLFQATGANMGGFIVVKYDGVPMGLRKIDTTITDGKIFVLPELPNPDELEAIIKEMQQAIYTVNKMKEDL